MLETIAEIFFYLSSTTWGGPVLATLFLLPIALPFMRRLTRTCFPDTAPAPAGSDASETLDASRTSIVQVEDIVDRTIA